MDILRITDAAAKAYVAAQLCADAKAEVLAKRSGQHVHTLRYNLQRLLDLDVIQRRVVINTYQSGNLQFSMYLNVLFDTETARTSFIQALLHAPQVIDVFEVGGEFQFLVVKRVKEIEELHEFWCELSALEGVRLEGKAICARLAVSILERSYLAKTKGKRKCLTYRKSRPAISLSEDDSQLLARIALTPHSSNRDLARRLQLPHSTLAQRLKQFEQGGLIVGRIYGMQVARLGIQSFRVLVATRGMKSDSWELLSELALDEPNVVILVQCIGNWDFELMVEVEQAHHVQEIIARIYQKLGSEVDSIQTLSMFRFLKSQHSIVAQN